MKALPWLRLYTETIDDEKLGLLAFEDRWHFIALLCLKGKGILDSEPDTEMLWRKAALKMGLTVAELEKVVSRLARMKLIDCKTLQPLAWNDRQAQSDSSTERTRKYREKKRAINGKHGGDDAETSQERPSDGLEEDTDTDTEEETEKEEKKKATRKRAAPSSFELPDWINRQHWDAWHSCSKRRNATDKQKQLAVDKLAAWRKEGVDYAAALENAAIAGWQGLFKPDVPAAAMTPARRTPATENFASRTYTGGKL